MRSFEINGTSVLVAYNWHVSDVINARSIFDATIVDKLSLSAVETGQEIKVYTDELLSNARDIGDGTFSRTSNATMQNGTNVTANVTRYETGQFGQAVMVEEGTTNLADLALVKSYLGGNLAPLDVYYTILGNRITATSQPLGSVIPGWKINILTNQAVTISGKTNLTGTKVFYYKGYDISDAQVFAQTYVNVIMVNGTFLKTITMGNYPTLSYINISVGSDTDADYWEEDIQVEIKPHKTSFITGGITRQPETLTIPTAGVLSDSIPWTIECWAKTDFETFDTYRTLFTAWTKFYVSLYSSNIIILSWVDGIQKNENSIYPVVSPDNWHHYAFTWDGTTAKIYVDGVLVINVTLNLSAVLPVVLEIGSLVGGYQWDGLIDDLRISNIARDDAEILDSYNTGAALPIDAHTTAKMALDGTLEIFARPVIFAGTIDAPEAIETDPGYLYYPITAVDYNQIADKRLYAASHESTLAGNIISAIISAKLSEEGVTAGSIEDGPVITKANFNYKKCSESLDYLKDVSGMNWNIDFDKQLNFFSNSTNLAPWILNDTVQHSNFRIKKNRSQYRNRQYVRAGTGKTTTQSLEKPSPAPDGSSRSFVLRFPVAEKPVIFVNSTAILSANVGVNGLDTGKSWYFSYDSNTISQESSTAVLTSGSTLEITYTGLYPIVMLIDDPAQIAARAAIETGTSGIYENLHTEKSINERNQAIEYTQGLILRYGIIPSTITFDTEVPGLRAGQLLPIQKTLFGINASYLIESVDISAADVGQINYSVRCLDGSALGGWETFFRDLLKAGQEYIIQENEVIVTLNLQAETENWGSTMTINIYNTSLYGANWSLIQRLGTELTVASLSYLGSGIVIAGTAVTGQIYKSTDYGASWSLIQRLGTETNVYSLSYLGSGIVLAGTSGGKIYKSTNSGASWSLIQQLGFEGSVYSLVNLGSGIALAGTAPHGYIYKSTDYGATWSYIQQLGSEASVYSLSYLGSGIVLAGTHPTGQIYKSTDYGASWSLIQQLGTENYVLSLSYLGSGIVLAGTATTGQIYKSTDYGASWSYIQRLGSEVYVFSLASLNNGIVIAGTAVSGKIYKSTNSGASWSLIQQLGSESEVDSLCYLGSGIVIAGTGDGGNLYKSITAPTSTEVLHD
jgi:photosystem II stability/assembly factor-like uncharacterized protein